ncbi:DUF4169 family protein [Acetobacteraceae bacterium KSS8]|uniref:DUF4169 family protein n=1 Tax=Endosaccharibacter trunci TaxID=2812733 RepID=A0ABT1W312_9PROT|nr:DUF4169 family protein [Acetobacteraceae bacterium KSS8]
MGEIVNLRTVRRRRDRAQQAEQAAGNRARFGRTGAEKTADRLDRDRAERQLDNARLDDPDRRAP